MADALQQAAEYESSLRDLTVNSKPLINVLTMLAEENIAIAPYIVLTIEKHLQKVSGDVKLPVLYLIDSILKNVGNEYTALFTLNLVPMFCEAFEKVDEKTRSQMFKLRQTWSDVLPAMKLYELDKKVASCLDPAWPVAPLPVASSPNNRIHFNPKFLNSSTAAPSVALPALTTFSPTPIGTASSQNVQDTARKERDLQQQKLELQQKKKESKLLAEKVRLAEEKAQLQKPNPKEKPPPDPAANINAVEADNNLAIEKFIEAKIVAAAAASDKTLSADQLAALREAILMKRPLSAIQAQVAKVQATPSPSVQAPAVPIIKTTVQSPVVPSVAGSKPTTQSGNTSSVVTSSVISAHSTPVPIISPAALPSNTVPAVSIVTTRSASTIPQPEPVKAKTNSSSIDTATTTVATPVSKVSAALTKSTAPLQQTTRVTINPASSLLINAAQRIRDPRLRKIKEEKPPDTQGSQPAAKSSEATSSKPASISGKTKVDQTVTSQSSKSEKRSERSNKDMRRKPKKRSKESETSSSSPKGSSKVITDGNAKPTVETNAKVVEEVKEVVIEEVPKIVAKDVDLRLLPTSPSKKRLTDLGGEEPPSKKSKAEMFNMLFGSEDVDLRQLPQPQLPVVSSVIIPPAGPINPIIPAVVQMFDNKIIPNPASQVTPGEVVITPPVAPKISNTDVEPATKSPSRKESSKFSEKSRKKKSPSPPLSKTPSPPPPPIISNRDSPLKESTKENSRSWAKYKEVKPDTFKSPYRIPTKRFNPRQELHKQISSNRAASVIQHSSPLNFHPELESKMDVNMHISNNSYHSTSAHAETKHNNVPNLRNQANDSMVELENPPYGHVEPLRSEKRRHGGHSETRHHKHSTHSESRRGSEHHSAGRMETYSDIHLDIHHHPDLPGQPQSLPKSLPPQSLPQPSPQSLPQPRPTHLHPLPQPPLPLPPRPDRLMSDRPDLPSAYQRLSGLPGPPAPFLRPGMAPFRSRFPPVPVRSDFKPVDPKLLEICAMDVMHTINIDSIPREIRFYGQTAIIFLGWDDPREISFQDGCRNVIFDEEDSIELKLNDEAVDFELDGKVHKIRLGAPTRELYIDDKGFPLGWNTEPIAVFIDGKQHFVQLEGEPPPVKISPDKRLDLVAGKISLVIDGEAMISIYLDYKPQRFDVDGIPYVLQFKSALERVLINGRPFRTDFGGVPKPLYLNGVRHFLRLTELPKGIVPGQISLYGMDDYKPSSPPPPSVSLPSKKLEDGLSSNQPPDHNLSNRPVKTSEQSKPSLLSQPKPAAQSHLPPIGNSVRQEIEKPSAPLDLLTGILPTPVTTASNSSLPVSSTEPTTRGKISETASLLGKDINVTELFQKLVAIGIVGNKSDSKKEEQNDSEMKPVDFTKPETLKVKQPAMITKLYSGIQCSTCGLRFPAEFTDRYSQHLDWHFRQNRRERDSARTVQSRQWYYDISDWIQFEEIEVLEERVQSWFEAQLTDEEGREIPGELLSIPAGSDTAEGVCELCHDPFELFYHEETEEWHFRHAICIDKKLYHPICHQDWLLSLELEAAENSRKEQEAEEKRKEEELKAKEMEEEKLKEEKEKEKESKEVATGENVKEEKEEKEKPDEKMEVVKEDVKVEMVENESEVKEPIADADEPMEVTPEGDSEQVKKEKEDEEIVNSGEETQSVIQEITIQLKPDPGVENMETDGTEEPESTEDVDLADVKEEKEDVDVAPVPDSLVDTTHAAVTSSIDGNVELVESSQVVGTNKIVINISKPSVASPAREEPSEPVIEETEPISITTSDVSIEPDQPFPPGLEPDQPVVKLKPRLIGRKLTEYPPISKGTELSGLCSIM